MTDKIIFQLSPAKNPFLGNLPAAAMEELMNLGKVQRLTDGEPFIREGDPSDSIYFVSFGEVAVLKGGVEIDTMRTGGVIGEMGVFKGVPRSATIKCKNQPSAAHAQTGKAASHGGLFPDELGLRWQALRQPWHVPVASRAAPVGPVACVALRSRVQGFEPVATLQGLEQLRVALDAEQRAENHLALLRRDGVGHKYRDERHRLRRGNHLQRRAWRCRSPP